MIVLQGVALKITAWFLVGNGGMGYWDYYGGPYLEGRFRLYLVGGLVVVTKLT